MDSNPKKELPPDAKASPRSRRWLLAIGSAGIALCLGFFSFNPTQAQALVHDFGYFLITFTLGWLVIHLLRIGREYPNRKPSGKISMIKFGWRGLLCPTRRWAVLAVLGTSLLCLIAEPAREKIIFDEYVLQSTAMHLHFTRKVSALVQGHDINGVFLPTRDYLDKRPYFFALLLSLVHDLTGYRLGNVYFLNAVLTVFALAMLFVVARRLVSYSGGILAVLLLGTLPLLAQNSSGAGMEMLNLAMLLLSLWLGILAAERPSESRLGAFVLAVVLLAQTRYESALYVFAVMLVLAGIWWREKKIILPWAAVAAPLLMVPIPLLQRVLYAHPIMWDLPKNLDSRFALSHLGNNLKHAGALLISVSREIPNSPLLVLLGMSGLLVLIWWVLRRPVRLLADPAHWVVVSFGLVLFGNLSLLMFYFWGELDDPMVSRLALPLYALFACCAAGGLARLDRKRPAMRWGIVAALVALPLTYGRAVPLHLYSSKNLVAAEIRWEKAWVEGRERGPRFIITNKSCLPWLLQHQASELMLGVREKGAQLAFHLREGTFVEILVMQRMRATTPQGDFAVDAGEMLPPGFQLQPLVEKRFGVTVDRISRLVSVDLGTPLPVTR